MLRWRNAQVAIENFATSIASAAVASQQDLPSFKMPFFDQHAKDVTELSSGALAVGWAPAVPATEGIGIALPISQFGAATGDDDEFMTEFLRNFNLLSRDTAMGELFYNMMVSSEPLQTGLRPLDFWSNSSELHTMMLHPILDGILGETQKPIVAGVAFSILSWNAIFNDVLAPNSGLVVVVLEDTCDEDAVLTYELKGQTATFWGYDDLHDEAYSDTEKAFRLASLSQSAPICEYIVRVFASKDLANMYLSPAPWIYAGIVCMVMIFFVVVFVVYDRFVQHRQERVLAKAARSNAIVASLFPSNVRDRILRDAESQVVKKEMSKKLGTTGKSQLKSYLDGTGQTEEDGSKPIADLFPHCTVMFGDIAGKHCIFTDRLALVATPNKVLHVTPLFEFQYQASLPGAPFENLAKSSNFWRRSIMPLMKLPCVVACTRLRP